MTEQKEKTQMAVDVMVMVIKDVPPHVGNIIFQCTQPDLSFYRSALFSQSVVNASIKKKLFVSVISIEKDTLFPFLESLDDWE